MLGVVVVGASTSFFFFFLFFFNFLGSVLDYFTSEKSTIFVKNFLSLLLLPVGCWHQSGYATMERVSGQGHFSPILQAYDCASTGWTALFDNLMFTKEVV